MLNRKITLQLGVGALALVLAIPAFAHAQAQTTPAQPAQPAPNTPVQPGQMMPWMGRGWGRHEGFGMRGGMMGMRGGMSLLPATIQVTGMTADDVAKQLQAGKSLAQVAESKGKTGDDIVQAAHTAMQTKLDTAVTAGWMSREMADAQLKAFDLTAGVIVKDTTLGTNMSQGKPFGFMHGGGPCPYMNNGTAPNGTTPNGATPNTAKPNGNTRGMWFQRLFRGNDA